MTLPWGQGTCEGKVLKGQGDHEGLARHSEQLGSRYWLHRQLPCWRAYGQHAHPAQLPPTSLAVMSLCQTKHEQRSWQQLVLVSTF